MRYSSFLLEGYQLSYVFKSSEALMNKCREIDRNLGHYAEKLSRILWRWPELRLLIVVGVLIIMDFASTYALLGLNKSQDVYESGRLAFWALERGGFPLLFIVDITAAVILSLAALIARRLYIKHGFTGYGRAAFVFILTPYIIVTVLAIANNISLQFR
jgi:hypothetical protein